MGINAIQKYFKNTVTSPEALEDRSKPKPLTRKLFDVASAAISGLGNYPFYGVAASFGNKYSTVLGNVLGVSEFSSYFAFRIMNFQQIREKFFKRPSQDEIAIAQPPSDSGVSEPGEDQKNSRWSSCKEIGVKVTSALLGIAAQYPNMVLTYYGNNENIIYPVITAACEGAFTILSLLLSFESISKKSNELDPETQSKLNLFIGKIDNFIQDLPTKYKDASFTTEIERIFSNNSSTTAEQKTTDLLNLILQSQGAPKSKSNSKDKIGEKIATAIGILFTAYLTTVTAAVTYKGLIDWKEDLGVAIFGMAFVSLVRLRLLSKLCIDSAKYYQKSFSDLIKRRYQAPLVASVSPILWGISRVANTALAWLSFGATAVSARDYVPVAGNALIGPAPVSSALYLQAGLNNGTDELLLWANSKFNTTAAKFEHLQLSLLQFREKIQKAHPETLRQFLDNLDLNQQPLKERSPQSATEASPLLDVVSPDALV